MTLRGPADADAFRVKVGRYGDRWYHDPLPTDAVAEATDESWPSATTIKKAWPKFLTSWAATEAAKYAVTERAAWQNLDEATAIKVIAGASDRTRDRAGQRGTKVHDLLERISQGHALDDVVDHEVAEWGDAMRALIDEVAPEWILAEAVAISRTLGVAGTLDAVWRIDGRHYIVDFKTRGEGKVGNAYPDEGVQLGIYASADYVIVEHDGHAIRQEMPPLDGGLIVTIAPEGYRLFPVDLDAARKGAAVLREFWTVQANRDIVGKPVVLKRPADPKAAAARLERRAWLVGCIEAIRDAGHLDDLAAIWPDNVPTFRAQREHADTQLDAIAAAVNAIGAKFELPFFDPDPVDRKPLAPHSLDAARVDRLRAEFDDDVLFVGLVREACLHEGRSLSAFTPDDVRRLDNLCAAVKAGGISITLADDGTPAVWSTFDLAAYVDRHADRAAALAHACTVAATVGARVPTSLVDLAADPLLAAALTVEVVAA